MESSTLGSTLGSPRAAVAQLCSTDDIDANLATCERLAAQAADRGCRLIVLPECFAFLGERERDKFGIAEVLDEKNPGRVLATIQKIATEHKMWVIAGGIAELKPEDRDLAEPTTAYNSCAVVNPEGQLVSVYRKIHLFDVDIPGGATLKESAATTRGEDMLAVDTSIGRVGLSICYDLRFPELYRALTLDQGAQVLVVPAAFTAHTGAAHWHTLLRARAIENQCWVLAAGQSGRHNDKRASYGHSLIIDPWGEIRAEVEAGDGIAVADIDSSFTEEKRTQLPCLTHSVLRSPAK
jgi:predicted amidohydrolase